MINRAMGVEYLHLAKYLGYNVGDRAAEAPIGLWPGVARNTKASMTAVVQAMHLLAYVRWQNCHRQIYRTDQTLRCY
jgi:hypothetical protein